MIRTSDDAVFAGTTFFRFNSILFGLILLLNGCATAEIGRQIISEETAWIQKGMTTRSEIVQRFGAPNFEFLDYTDQQYQSTTTSKTTKERDTSTTTTTVQVQPPRGTKATYMHTQSEAAVLPLYANMQTKQNQFWVG